MAKLRNNLSKLIKEYRKKNPETTQVDIARMIGIDPSTLSQYKNGQISTINIEIWEKLSELFQVPGSAIFEIKEEEEIP
jgi:DNA-binding XRE family transcriptional regulator